MAEVTLGPSSGTDEHLRHYLMERRRVLKDELATIERQLGIPNKVKELECRVRDLEEQLDLKA